jgi:hypothetical protein
MVTADSSLDLPPFAARTPGKPGNASGPRLGAV